jgi:hypothetical protein
VADESFELKVRLISEAETGWYNELMAGHHSLGAAASGRVLRYVAEAGGVPVVLGTFGSAAWRVPVRDERIGWSEEQRRARLERVCANQHYGEKGIMQSSPRETRERRVCRWLGSA